MFRKLERILIKRLGGDQGESLNLDFPYHFASPALRNWSPRTSRDDCGQQPLS